MLVQGKMKYSNFLHLCCCTQLTNHLVAIHSIKIRKLSCPFKQKSIELKLEQRKPQLHFKNCVMIKQKTNTETNLTHHIDINNKMKPVHSVNELNFNMALHDLVEYETTEKTFTKHQI